MFFLSVGGFSRNIHSDRLYSHRQSAALWFTSSQCVAEGGSTMRFLVHADLASKGIRYSRAHIKRLVAAKKFPAPVRGVAQENAWPETVIDDYLKERVAEARDRAAAA
jgi:prophage regulatory protein